VLDVSRQIRARLCLDERRELRVDGSRARRQRLERDGGRQPALEATPERLGDTGPGRCLGLREPKRDPTIAKPDAEPAGEVDRAPPGTHRVRGRAPAPIGHGHLLIH
jgi:hypothetical protein